MRYFSNEKGNRRMKNISVELWKWFPADDEFAIAMARLCILREELMFEFNCAKESRNVTTKDNYGSSWGRLYFFRKMSNTLLEIRKAIETIAPDKKFKLFLRNQSPDFKKEFKQLQSNLNSTKDIIKDIRDNIGTHINSAPVNKALQTMSNERSGFLQISWDNPQKTHYKFAEELIMAVMFRDTPDEQQMNKANEIMDALTKVMTELFVRLDMLFFTYARDRKLIEIKDSLPVDIVFP
jgi:hypothetical protein